MSNAYSHSHIIVTILKIQNGSITPKSFLCLFVVKFSPQSLKTRIKYLDSLALCGYHLVLLILPMGTGVRVNGTRKC